MDRLRKFVRLTPLERGLLIKAMLLLGLIGLGLRLVPFAALWRILARMSRPTTKTSGKAEGAYVRGVTWAVSTAGRHMPRRAGCLGQALAAKALLSRRGIQARLCIGVDRPGERTLHAHAWVEFRGAVVVGEADDLSRYTVLRARDSEVL
jgi:hypothetical protein